MNAHSIAVALGWTLAFSVAAAASTAAPKSFPTPDAAFIAFQVAVKNSDLKALEAMLGPKGKDLIYSGDRVADANARQALAAAYDARHRVSLLGSGHAVLQVGADNWEMPIPLVKIGEGWRFDVATARDEVLNRRVGKNEIRAMAAAYAYVDAQREYARRDRGNGTLSYAQRFLSSPGQKDGLYWPAKPGEAESPLGPAYTKARGEGYRPEPMQAAVAAVQNDPAVSAPFHGYVYRILKAQGATARGGKLNYVVNDRMIGGHALVAYPAMYGISGVMTFIINNDAKLYQKDLGPNTAALAAAINAFNPDPSWSPVK